MKRSLDQIINRKETHSSPHSSTAKEGERMAAQLNKCVTGLREIEMEDTELDDSSKLNHTKVAP